MSSERLPLLEKGGVRMYDSEEGRKTTVTYENFHCHDEASPSDSNESNKKAVKLLWLIFFMSMFFMICEVVGGYIAGSLAIITDAAHLITDAASVLISLFSLYLARRPPSQTMSFGFHRAEVLGAFISVFMIWVMTGILVFLAVMRIIQGDYEVEGSVMAITATLGVIVNIIMLAVLHFTGHGHSHGGGGSHSHSHQPESIHVHHHSNSSDSSSDSQSLHNERNINVRSTLVHIAGDFLQSVGVLVASLFIYFKPDWVIIDPICTLFFSIIVLCTTVWVLRDAMIVLLEGRPRNIDFPQVFASLAAIEGVQKVHDLRIWALTMEKIALSVHLEVDASSQPQMILRETRKMLKQTYNVHEITIQIEEFKPKMTNCVKCDIPSK